MRSLKGLCIDSEVLQPNDLPSITRFPKPDDEGCGPEQLKLGGCKIVQIGSGQSTPAVPTTPPNRRAHPARQPWWPKKWKPNETNRPAFNAWFESQRPSLGSVPGDESLRLIKQKMCELDLLAPDECAALGLPSPAASQPTTHPAPP